MSWGSLVSTGMASIQQYIYYILGAVIVLLLIFCSVQTVRLKVAEAQRETAIATAAVKEAQLQSQLAVVRQLAANGEELTARITESQTTAAREKQKLRDELETWKKIRAPIDCEGAAEWAKQRAETLSGRW